jgi:hypothetical protein
LAGARRSDGDDQLRQVAQGGIEQSAGGIAGLGGDRLGGMAEQRAARETASAAPQPSFGHCRDRL